MTAEPCWGHTEDEIATLVADLRQEHKRAMEEMESFYPDEDTTRLDEIWNARWELDHEILGVGWSRIAVGLCEKHVLKVELGTGIQNGNEWAVWSAADGELKTWLCPILGHGVAEKGEWLLLPRVAKATSLAAETIAMVDRLHGLHDLEGYSEALGGIHWEMGNFGEFEGRQVIVDYGDCDPGEVRLEPAVPSLQ